MKKPVIIKTLVNRFYSYHAVIAIMQVAFISAVGIILIIFGDAVFVLPESFRKLIPLVLASLILLMLVTAFFWILRINNLKIARWIEKKDPNTGNILTNAVQLSEKPARSNIHDLLCREAVKLGQDMASQIKLWPFMRRQVKLWIFLNLTILCIFGFGTILFSDLFSAVVPRILDPTGDHPPYSRLVLKVSPGNTSVVYGQNIDIHVQARGRPVENLYIIATTDTNIQTMPMFLSPDHIYCQTLTQIEKPMRYHVTDGRGRSHWFNIDIILTPKIKDIQVDITPPEYTGLPTKQTSIYHKNIKIAAGSTVVFTVKSNRPLTSGTITLKPVHGGQTITKTLYCNKDKKTVSHSFKLDKSVIFSVSIKDKNGLTSAETKQGRIDIINDRQPEIYALAPGKNAVATPESIIPVAVQVEDDYGIKKILWFKGINHSMEHSIQMSFPETKKSQKSITAHADLDLKDLGLRAGDVIEYFFEAVDNNPDTPHLITSSLYQLEIISMEQYRKILEQKARQKKLFQTYNKLGKWLNNLTDRAHSLTLKTDSTQLAELISDLNKYRQAIEKKLKQPGLFDVEKMFHKQLQDQYKTLKELDEKTPGDTHQAAIAIHKELTRLAQSERKIIKIPSQRIRAVALLMAEAAKFASLIKQQAEIVHLGRRFFNKFNLSRTNRLELAEIGNREQQINQTLNLLLNNIENHMNSLPLTREYKKLQNTVNQFRNSILNANILKLLEQASTAFTELQGALAYDLSVKALKAMKRFTSNCNKFGQQGHQALCFQSLLQKNLGNTLDQILAAMGSGLGAGDGRHGYSMIAEQVALYGPGAELIQNNIGRNSLKTDKNRDKQTTVMSMPNKKHQKTNELFQSIEMMESVKFPDKYRDLIGDYFRKVSESITESH